MIVAVCSDHRGFECKRHMLVVLRKLGHEVIDVGCDGTGPADYPDFAVLLARLVSAGKADVGICFDGTGVGMSMTANRFRGVRAAQVYDEVHARRAREHNHANVLSLGADLIGDEQMRKIIEIFLATPYGEGRHRRRVEKIEQFGHVVGDGEK
jgi:ribose 5-phosphate isomerase B